MFIGKHQYNSIVLWNSLIPWAKNNWILYMKDIFQIVNVLGLF